MRVAWRRNVTLVDRMPKKNGHCRYFKEFFTHFVKKKHCTENRYNVLCISRRGGLSQLSTVRGLHNEQIENIRQGVEISA